MKTFVVIHFLSIFVSESSTVIFESTFNPLIDPCHDFYDYVCSKDTRIIRKQLSDAQINGKVPLFLKEVIEDIRRNEDVPHSDLLSRMKNSSSGKILVLKHVHFSKLNKTVSLDSLVDLQKIMKWFSEIECVYTGILSPDYFGDLYSSRKLNHSERYQVVLKRLTALNLTSIDVFYNALVDSVDILKLLKPPVSKRNAFLHWLFDMVKNSTLQEIMLANVTDVARTKLFDNMNRIDSYFAFYDFNNVTVIEKVKAVYEQKYHTLRSMLSENDLEKPEAEKILRLGAIDAAMVDLSKYIGIYSERFVFQAVVANPTNDAFQYMRNNHITVITRNDPHQPAKALADTVFVTMHEMFHNLYPFGEASIGSEVYKAAMNCSSESMEMLGNTDSVKPKSKNWFNKNVAHEDVVNIIAMRVVMKLASQKAKNDDQLRRDLETVVGGLCRQNVRKNEHIPHHNPLETSLNNAVRQYPLFRTLYQCKTGDRMYARNSEICEPMGRTNTLKEYKVKQESDKSDVGGFFQYLIEVSKKMKFSYGDL